MNRASAFWDASALVPLCVQEQSSSQVRALFRQFLPVVWWATSVEMRSAFARRNRLGDLSDAEFKTASRGLDVLQNGWREISPGDRLRELAEALVARYPLRAADSLQLAAALIWCQQRPSQRSFLSADDRLCDAAEQVGFAVVRL